MIMRDVMHAIVLLYILYMIIVNRGNSGRA